MVGDTIDRFWRGVVAFLAMFVILLAIQVWVEQREPATVDPSVLDFPSPAGER